MWLRLTEPAVSMATWRRAKCRTTLLSFPTSAMTSTVAAMAPNSANTILTNDNGTQVGLNPALMALGDQALQRLVAAIHASPAWSRGHNAIITIWDED